MPTSLCSGLESVLSRNRAAALFSFALAGAILSKSMALLLGFALDDYAAIYTDVSIDWFLSQGRFTQALIQLAMSGLGLPSPEIYWPIVLLLLPTIAICVTLAIEIVTAGRGGVLTACASALVMGAHPYLSEYFSFRQALPTLWISFVLFGFYLYLIGQQLRRLSPGDGGWILSCIVLVIATGAQQNVFVLAACVTVAAVAASAIRAEGGVSLRKSLSDQWPAVKVLAISAIAYILVFIAIKVIGGYQQDARSALVSPGDLPQRLHQIAHLGLSILFRAEPLVPVAGKVAFWACVAWLLLSARPAIVRTAAGGAATLAACLALSVLLVAISAVWWPTPRALHVVGFALGLTIAVLGVASPRPNAAWVPGIAFGFVLSLQSSALLFEQQRINRWDMNKALLLAADIERAAGAQKELEVVVVNGSWRHPIPLPTTTHDLNISAFGTWWALEGLLAEASGRRWKFVPGPVPDAICAGRKPWPSPDGLLMTAGNRLVACL